MKMLNSNICCKNLDELTEKVGNIIVPTNKKTYKRLEVVESGKRKLTLLEKIYKFFGKKVQENEDKIEVGKVIYVPINSGHEVEVEEVTYTIVNAREIILILD